MRDPFEAAAPVFFTAFADLEPVIYIQAGVPLPPIRAIRSTDPAPGFAGPGSSLRKVSYEIRYSDLTDEPTKRDKLAHRGRLWAIQEVTRCDDVGAWLVVVVDAGAL